MNIWNIWRTLKIQLLKKIQLENRQKTSYWIGYTGDKWAHEKSAGPLTLRETENHQGVGPLAGPLLCPSKRHWQRPLSLRGAERVRGSPSTALRSPPPRAGVARDCRAGYSAHPWRRSVRPRARLSLPPDPRAGLGARPGPPLGAARGDGTPAGGRARLLPGLWRTAGARGPGWGPEGLFLAACSLRLLWRFANPLAGQLIC